MSERTFFSMIIGFDLLDLCGDDRSTANFLWHTAQQQTNSMRSLSLLSILLSLSPSSELGKQGGSTTGGDNTSSTETTGSSATGGSYKPTEHDGLKEDGTPDLRVKGNK